MLSPNTESSPNVVMQWLRRNFSDPGVISFLVVLAVVVILVELIGNVLAPIVVSILIAYMLDALVGRLVRFKIPHFVAVLLIFCLFVAIYAVLLLWLLPLLTKQLFMLVNQLPHAVAQAKIYLAQLMQRFPKKIAPSQLQYVMGLFQTQVSHLGRYLLNFSLATIPGLISVVLYLVLVPVMVFFFIKDKLTIRRWFSRLMPTNREVIDSFLHEVQSKIGQYVKGRILEIIIVGVVSGVVFSLLGLYYAILLACVVGISVIIPYVGAVIATIPIVVVGLMQWGLTASFIYLMIAYVIIVFLDGNILVPLLFAETMDLHPVAIIISILVFGAIWGFWGVFFAIPLATVFKAAMEIWPRLRDSAVQTQEDGDAAAPHS